MKLNMYDTVTYSAVKGKQIIVLLRCKEDAASAAAALVPFSTTDSENISADSDSTVTKDGVLNAPGVPSIELSKEALMSFNSADPDSTTIVDKLKAAVKNGKLVEAWVVNLDRPGSTTGKYMGTYYQGYLSSFEVEGEAEGLATVSMDYAANGKGADGECTVDTAALEIASYVFTDTTASGTSGTH